MTKHLVTEEETDEVNRLAKRFDGKVVRVYLYNGAAVTGRAVFNNGWVTVTEVREGGKSSACNLDHVISIATVE